MTAPTPPSSDAFSALADALLGLFDDGVPAVLRNAQMPFSTHEVFEWVRTVHPPSSCSPAASKIDAVKRSWGLSPEPSGEATSPAPERPIELYRGGGVLLDPSPFVPTEAHPNFEAWIEAMRPERLDHLLESYRESTGPDADARARLMGRLAALGPPEAEEPASRRVFWPWVAAVATLAAAAVALWISPRIQEAVTESPNGSLASDQAVTADTDGVARPQTPPMPVRQRAAPRPEPAIAPAIAPTPPEVLEAPEPTAPVEPAPRKRARTRKAKPEPSTRAEPTEVDTLAVEAALIGKAPAALARGQAEKTLQHLREYEATFDAPRFHEEAAALRAMALCTKSGPHVDAAAAISQAHPRSMFRKRVQEACAAHENKSDVK